MNFLSRIQKTVQLVKTEWIAPELLTRGEEMEDYARERIFYATHYTLLERTHSRAVSQSRSGQSFLNPDFKFLDLRTKKKFWLEIKWRSEEYGGKIHWCSEEQLYHYQACHREYATFVLLGIGGMPAAPAHLYLLSMSQARSAALSEALVQQFEIPADRPITSSLLWNR